MSRQHNEYLFIKKIKHAVSMRCCIRAIEQSAFYPMMQKELLQYEIKWFIYITKLTLAYKINRFY